MSGPVVDTRIAMAMAIRDHVHDTMPAGEHNCCQHPGSAVEGRARCQAVCRAHGTVEDATSRSSSAIPSYAQELAAYRATVASANGSSAAEVADGAVPLIQCFGSAADLNNNLRCLVLDGACQNSTEGDLIFVEMPAPTDESGAGAAAV
jgi:hypothetical protein